MPQPHNFQMMEDTFESSVLENSVWTANQQKSHATILSRNRFEKGKYIMLESGKKKQTNKQRNKHSKATFGQAFLVFFQHLMWVMMPQNQWEEWSVGIFRVPLHHIHQLLVSSEQLLHTSTYT